MHGPSYCSNWKTGVETPLPPALTIKPQRFEIFQVTFFTNVLNPKTDCTNCLFQKDFYTAVNRTALVHYILLQLLQLANTCQLNLCATFIDLVYCILCWKAICNRWCICINVYRNTSLGEKSDYTCKCKHKKNSAGSNQGRCILYHNSWLRSWEATQAVHEGSGPTPQFFSPLKLGGSYHL